MTYQLPSTIDPSIFRSYDIRGVVAENFSADVVYAIGRAIGTIAREQQQTEIVTARDGRLSSPELIKPLQQGLIESGLQVIDIGMVPTPVLYYATHALETRSGVMLTASHNPAPYNGLKIVIDRKTLAEGGVQDIYQRAIQGDYIDGAGSLSERDILPQYFDSITSSVKLDRPLKVVVDCGNGVAGNLVPQLYRDLGCEVTELYCEVDGRFPNHHPDPTIVENLQTLIKTVQETNADVGFGYDGDADRLGVVTNKGEIIWPDRQLMLFAKDILSRNPGGKMLFDVKCSRHLAHIIQDHGGEPIMWKTGHSLVKKKMWETGALLAGEMSGHIFFKERWFGFDDAMYTGARLLEILSHTQQTSSEVFQTIPDSVNTPELKLYMDEEKKQTFMQQLKQQANFADATIIDIDGLRVEFDDGWGLIRCSNTTPCLVLRFEADTAAGLERIKDLFRREILACDSSLTLPY